MQAASCLYQQWILITFQLFFTAEVEIESEFHHNFLTLECQLNVKSRFVLSECLCLQSSPFEIEPKTLWKALRGAQRSSCSAHTADRYLGEAFIPHSLDIKLIQNLRRFPSAVDWQSSVTLFSWSWRSEAQLLGLHVPFRFWYWGCGLQACHHSSSRSRCLSNFECDAPQHEKQWRVTSVKFQF